MQPKLSLRKAQATKYMLFLLCACLFYADLVGQTFRNPIRWNAADPTMAYHNGFYYVTYTNGSQLDIVKASSINAIPATAPVTVWTDPNPSRCCHMWAPSLRQLNGPNGLRWYLYYCADNGNDVNHRNYVLESQGSDPMGPYVWKNKLIPLSGDEKGIDGNVLVRDDGALFFIWCFNSTIAIATMSNPWTVSSNKVIISTPTYSWETQQGAINENPSILKRNGKTYLTYSASNCTSPNYAVGMLVNTDGNYMNPGSWTKLASPIFLKSPDDGVYGVGGNDFFKSPDGNEDWIVYHATANANGDCGGGRSVRVQKIGWNGDDSPLFGLPVSETTDLFLPAGDVNADPLNTRSIQSGTTYKFRHKGTNKWLDVDNNSSASGANVWQWAPNTSDAQRWIVTREVDNHFTVRHKGTTQYLASANNSNASGADVVQMPDAGQNGQRWAIQLQPDGYYKFTRKGASICLDVDNNGNADGTNVIQWNDIGSDAQRWRLEQAGEIISGATYKLYHRGTNQCLDVYNNSNAEGAEVWQWTSNNTGSQFWVITLQPDGHYKLTHKGTNQCLDVSLNSNAPGANVQQWTDNGQDAQRWRFDYMGDSYFKIVHKNTNQCLDVHNNRSSSGANVMQYTDNGADAQRWRLELVELPPAPLMLTGAETKPAVSRLSVAPNPAYQSTTIKYTADTDEQVALYLYTMEGKLVKRIYQGNVRKHQGYTFPLTTAALPGGVYLIKAIGQTKTQLLKLIIQSPDK